MLVIIGQHLSSVKVKLSPSVQLPKAKIVAGNFRVFDFLCFLLCVLFCIQRLVHWESPDLPDSSSFLL